MRDAVGSGNETEKGLTLAVQADERLWEGELHRLRGEVRLARGRQDDAMMEFEQAISIAADREQRSRLAHDITAAAR